MNKKETLKKIIITDCDQDPKKRAVFKKKSQTFFISDNIEVECKPKLALSK